MVAAALAGCARREPVDLVIDNVTVLAVDSGETVSGHAVVVDGGRVREVAPARPLSPKGTSTPRAGPSIRAPRSSRTSP